MKRIIYQNETGGVSIIIPTGELPIEEVAAKDVPEGVPYEIVDEADIPSDRYFRNAWVMGDCCVEHDLDKCKEIGHDLRRQQRAEEFAPLDRVISLQLPGMDMVAAEAGRQQIRDKYALIQDVIEGASTPDDIKTALEVNQ
jgi:hypothetical protein